MRVTFCGVRGSTPAPGAEFARVGGHTSCVALARDDGPVTLVLDAGTGLRRVTHLLDGAPFRGTILCGHLHMDHVQGLPFFRAADRPDARTTVLVPEQGPSADELLERLYSPPVFPVRPADLLGRWHLATLDAGRHAIEGFDVVALDIPHPGGRTLGFRISDGHSAVAYLSDHCPVMLGPGDDGLGALHDAALALADGVDLLIHDAQFTPEQLARFPHYGHSALEYGVTLAVAAGARRLALFHHDPSRDDDGVDAVSAPVIADAAARGVEAFVAVEPATVTL